MNLGTLPTAILVAVMVIYMLSLSIAIAKNRRIKK